MKFTKLALGISLTAAFGLMACGGDSSADASAPDSGAESAFGDGDSADHGTCSVVHDGNTVGNEFSYFNTKNTDLRTKTFNEDGTITVHERTVAHGEYMTTVINEGCKNKRVTVDGYEDAEIEWIQCKDGVMEYKYTITDSEYNPAEMEDAIEYDLKSAREYCELLNGTSGSSSSADDEDEDEDLSSSSSALNGSVSSEDEDEEIVDNEESGDEEEIVDEEETGDEEIERAPHFSGDPKNCQFKETDDVWYAGDYKYEWEDDAVFVESFYSTDYAFVPSKEACKSASETYNDISPDNVSYCEEDVLVVEKEFYEQDRHDKFDLVSSSCKADVEE